MIRQITGFHADEEGDWVAELSCLHNQHIRHRPPFQERPWVETEEGRTGRLGTDIECPLCDRQELPDGLTPARRAGPFDETSLPTGLRRSHRIAARTWGLLRVHRGSLRLSLPEGTEDRILTTGAAQPIPPEVPHHVTVTGPVELTLDFLVPVGDPES